MIEDERLIFKGVNLSLWHQVKLLNKEYSYPWYRFTKCHVMQNHVTQIDMSVKAD